MAIILNIDTAVENASVCVSKDGDTLGFAFSAERQQASWLHVAIKKVMDEAGVELKELDAVGVTIGPGSYTGLRVGLSTAKGLCYGLKIPLIAIETLEMMAGSVVAEAVDLICPLIDARRMEVFTAVYDRSLRKIAAPSAMLIDADSFAELLQLHTVLFMGNGKEKLRKIIRNDNAFFSERVATAENMKSLTERNFKIKKFADLAYAEPLYLKEFFTGNR